MKISNEKKEKISEQIISFLYSTFPKPVFTKKIADEIARDEEFVKKLLLDLKQKNIISEIRKNPYGKDYIKRRRWKLKDHVYKAYNNIS